MVNNPIKNPTSVYVCVCVRVRRYVNARIQWRVPRDFTFSAATVDKFGQRSPIHTNWRRPARDQSCYKFSVSVYTYSKYKVYILYLFHA